MSEEGLNDRRVLAFIHTAKSRLLMSEKEYRDLLNEKFGVTSAKALTREQAEQLMDYFRDRGFGKKKRKWTCGLCAPRPKDSRPIPKDVIYPASPSQLAVIDALQKAVKWGHPDGYSLWLSKYFRLSKVEWSPQATQVITALKGLLRSQKQACAGCPFAAQMKGDI
ncbi:MAG: regulatory protein GemA [Syntrophorhabdales bacterium]|jgi:hypothetical protein